MRIAGAPSLDSHPRDLSSEDKIICLFSIICTILLCFQLSTYYKLRILLLAKEQVDADLLATRWVRICALFYTVALFHFSGYPDTIVIVFEITMKTTP